MNKHRRWTAEEERYLEENYGKVSTKYLCNKLNISYVRFRVKVRAMGLGYQRESTDLVTMRQVRSIMNIGHYATQRFIKADLPVVTKCFGKATNTLVRIDKLLEWLEQHQDMWDASKIEHLALGSEPEWLRAKRRKDMEVRNEKIHSNRRGQ